MISYRPNISKKQKELVTDRAKHCCEYCLSQRRFSPDPFSIEHIVTFSKEGSDNLDYLALACQGCNSHKYTAVLAIDLANGNEVSLYNPRQDEWEEHFVWNDDFSLVIGISLVGRATIIKLQINRIGVTNLRKVLSILGEHPPT